MKHMLLTGLFAATLTLPGAVLAQDLPASVSGLGLTNTEIRPKPVADYGTDIRGTLPGDILVEVELDRDNRIEEIEARGNAVFPLTAVESLIPAPVKANSAYPAGASLEKIEFERDGRIELDGRLADGREFDATFAADGTLLELDTDD